MIMMYIGVSCLMTFADFHQAAFAVEFMDACFQLMRLWGGLRAIQAVSCLLGKTDQADPCRNA
jgi:hypothetical protein